MKKETKPNPTIIATSLSIITATLTLFTTTLAAITSFKTLTPILQILYGSLGYNTTITGVILGTLYVTIDTFIITWLLVWTYNKLL
jgi:hypothetical protein